MVLEKTLESPLDSKEIQPVHSKGDQSWVFIGRTDVEAETLIFGHLMWRTDSFEKTLKLGKDWRQEEKGRGWDGWMASPTQWTWVWINSRSSCWTRRPGVLQFMGSQRVGHDWATVLNWTEGRWSHNIFCEIKCKFHYVNKPLGSKLPWTVVVFQQLYCFSI